MLRAVLLLSLLLASSLSMAAERESFLQGPERIGQERTVQGTVIGIHNDLGRTCALMLADLPREHWKGLGGGGRFFLCSPTLGFQMGQTWTGQVQQTETRRARVGPMWRTLPLFVPVS